MAGDLISIKQAVQQGVERVRKPIWADPFDHIKIDIINGELGPWLHLFAPFNKECNGRDPIDVLIISPVAGDINAEDFVPYDGPLPGSEEYQRAVAQYAGSMA